MKLKIPTVLAAILLTGLASWAQVAVEIPDQTNALPKAVQPTGDVAEKPTTDVPSAAPDLVTIQKELAGMSPEERKAKLKEYRDRYGAKKSAQTAKAPQQISAAEWNAYTPEQQAQLLHAWQANRQTGQLTPEQRQALLNLRQASMETQIQNLQLKQKIGTLTDREATALQQFEARQKRLIGQPIRPPQYRGSTVAPAPSTVPAGSN